MSEYLQAMINEHLDEANMDAGYPDDQGEPTFPASPDGETMADLSDTGLDNFSAALNTAVQTVLTGETLYQQTLVATTCLTGNTTLLITELKSALTTCAAAHHWPVDNVAVYQEIGIISILLRGAAVEARFGDVAEHVAEITISAGGGHTGVDLEMIDTERALRIPNDLIDVLVGR